MVARMVATSSAMATPADREKLRAMSRQAEQRKARRVERLAMYAFLSLPAMGLVWLAFLLVIGWWRP